MPDTQVHRKQATYNRNLAQFLLQQGYADWALIISFYSAVHQVDAVLAPMQTLGSWNHPKSHGDRETVMNLLQAVFPQNILDAYHKLKQGSEDTRYRCWKPTGEEVSRVYTPLLDTIERFANKRLRS